MINLQSLESMTLYKVHRDLVCGLRNMNIILTHFGITPLESQTF